MSKRQLHLGLSDEGDVFVTVKVTDRRVSITGVIGPKANGDARGSWGQITLSDINWRSFASGWNAKRVTELQQLWDRWHLNDMRAGCEHQRAAWDATEKLEVVSYSLTSDALHFRDATIKAAAAAALKGEPFNPCPQGRALAELTTWYRDIHEPPDADSPLSGCYEARKRETKTAGWVTQDEHPRGLLSKPCPTCGYKYGSAWLHEDVPFEVIETLTTLPLGDKQAPKCWQD